MHTRPTVTHTRVCKVWLHLSSAGIQSTYHHIAVLVNFIRKMKFPIYYKLKSYVFFYLLKYVERI